jgi:hypothetical protein
MVKRFDKIGSKKVKTFFLLEKRIQLIEVGLGGLDGFGRSSVVSRFIG